MAFTGFLALIAGVFGVVVLALALLFLEDVPGVAAEWLIPRLGRAAIVAVTFGTVRPRKLGLGAWYAGVLTASALFWAGWVFLAWIMRST